MSNAGNAQVNAGGDGTTRINLRGLGAPRTLVLINGRRMVNGGNGADASVDVNAIPLAMIERVEVLKDGASALYGADAVGGVVNIVTRPQFDGTDVSLLTSTSQRGDGIEYDASAVAGFASEHRNSYLVLSGGYQHHEPVLASDRAFSQFQDSYDFASRTVTRNQSLAGIGGRLDPSSIGPGGMVPTGCASGACTSCTGTCTAGATRCNGNTTQMCVADASGCTSWQNGQTCTNFCSGGACGTCGTTCAVGTRRCNGAGTETCVTDANNCTVWGQPSACAAGQFCNGGACATCAVSCTAGAKRCAATGGGIEECRTQGACNDWVLMAN